MAESVTLDLAALANITNAMVTLTNENSVLKQENAALLGLLKEAHEKANAEAEGQGQAEAGNQEPVRRRKG